MEMLLDKGINIDIKNNNGIIVLMVASLNGYGETVSRLLNRSVDVNIQDKNGWTVLIYVTKGNLFKL
jgi:ankyrin repeat protein